MRLKRVLILEARYVLIDDLIKKIVSTGGMFTLTLDTIWELPTYVLEEKENEHK